MRIAPLLFIIADKPIDDRFTITRRVSSITHAHQWSVAACFFYLEYLRKLLLGMDKYAAYAELPGDIQIMPYYFDRDTFNKYELIFKADINTVPEAEIKSGGFVMDTLEAAFWCFLTTDNYRDAVLKAVNLGEDTDTTAAVTGGLAGLYYGFETSDYSFGVGGIPYSWIVKLAGYKDILGVADRLAKRCTQ
jgi:ADP-ribosylglycohydrolase